MEIEKFKQLVYAKGFGTTLTQKLLGIANSSMAKELIFEDLLDLIWEYAEHTYTPDYDPEPENVCDTCDVGDDAEAARERAVNEMYVYQKEHTALKRGICDIIESFQHLSDPTIMTLIGRIEKRCLKKPELTGDEMFPDKIGIGVTEPAHLMHMKCECGKELYIEGKGWTVDFQGPVVFKCSCGKICTLPEPETPILCTGCKSDAYNPSCSTCDRLICPECEADNTDNPPCGNCDRNRPHA